MALKREVAKLDEVEEVHRSLYVEKDGKFVLDVDGGVAGPDQAAALEKERRARALADKTVSDLKKQMEGLDPAKAREALRIIAELEEKNLLGEGKFEEAVQKRVERIAAEAKQQTEALTNQNKALQSQLEELLIDNGLKTAAAKAGVKPTALDDVVLYGRQHWRLKDGKPVPMKGDEVLYGKEPNKPMTAEEWIAERSTDRPHWFEPSSGGGARGSDGTRQTGSQHVISSEKAKDFVAYKAAKAAADKAGLPLVIGQ